MPRDLSWREFVEGALALGAAVFEPTFDVEAHADALAALSARFDFDDPTLMARFEALEQGQTEDYRTEKVVKTETCGVMLVTLRSGGRVGLHDHPRQSGFLVCCGGQVDVEAFDIAAEQPLALRRTFAGSLGPGQAGSLLPGKRNVHRLYCPVATRLVDVFTPPLTDALHRACRSFALVAEIEPDVFSARLTAERGEA